MADYFDTIGDDRILGSGDNDTIRASMGGDDVVHAGAGDDRIYMGGALTANDRIDGGDGNDFVTLDGDYGSLTLHANSLQNVEWIEFGRGHSYNLTTDDANVAAGHQLVVSTVGLDATDQVIFNGWQERDGYFDFDLGGAAATLIGGAGDDTYFMQAALSGFDVFDGMGGYNLLTLRSEFQSRFDFAGNHLANIDEIDVIGPGASLALTDDVLLGGEMKIVAGSQTALDFDGSAERTGVYLVSGGDLADGLQGGRQADTIHGGGGDDRITGHGGADDLTGQDGSDTFAYERTSDSTVRAADVIHDLGVDDVIDLSAIDAKTGKTGDQAFHLVAAFDGRAGELTMRYDPVSAQTQLSLDVDGDGKADAMILIDGDHRDFANFVL